MDLFDIAVAKSLAGGGGGNPNHITTVTGTLDSMWGDTDLSALRTALNSNGATATCIADGSALGIGDISAKIYSVHDDFGADGGTATPFPSGYVAKWNEDGTLASFDMFQGSTVTDLSQYASMIPTTLTIVWHPMSGGGESNLTSATMTIVGGTVQMNAPICFDFSTIPDAQFPGYILPDTQSYDAGEYKVALFKGNAMCFISTEDITVSGSIQNFGGGAYLVSGDCTITH